jgi:hypothetical protein
MPKNAPKPTTSEIVGGTYNATPDVLEDGQADSLQLDVNGNLKVTVGGGAPGAPLNVNIADVNGTSPALTNPLPVELSDGVNAFGTASNPLSENVAQWGGTAVSAPPASGAAASGTEIAPVVKPISRKQGYISTSQLGNGGVFRGPGTLGAGVNAGWVDSVATGGHFLEVSVISDQSGTLVIQQSDDYTNTGLQRISATQSTNSSLWSIDSVIKSRYWRVVYTNGATPSTTLEIGITESTEVLYQTIAGAYAGGDTLAVQTTLQQTNQNASRTGALQVFQLTTSSSPDVALGSNVLSFSSNVFGQTALPASVSFGVTSGGTLPAMSAFRIPNIFKTAAATNFGNTAAWTPTSGKKFRLMRYQIELTENATLGVAALLTVKFQDATTDFGFQHDEYVPAAAGAVTGEAWRSGWIDMGNGYLSAAANNVLNFNISGAANLATGNFRINVCGCEE